MDCTRGWKGELGEGKPGWSIQDSLGSPKVPLYEVIGEISDQELLFKLAELVEHHVFIIGKESYNTWWGFG